MFEQGGIEKQWGGPTPPYTSYSRGNTTYYCNHYNHYTD